MRIEPFTKALALILWADEKISEQELALAREVCAKYDVAWDTAKPLLEKHIEDFLDPGDEAAEADEKGAFVEFDEELSIGCLDFGEGVDTYELLKDLSRFAVLDKQLSFREIDLIHTIAEASNTNKVLASAALLEAAAATGARLAL